MPDRIVAWLRSFYSPDPRGPVVRVVFVLSAIAVVVLVCVLGSQACRKYTGDDQDGSPERYARETPRTDGRGK